MWVIDNGILAYYPIFIESFNKQGKSALSLV